MTEIEKIKYAKLFIDKLANGINPLDDQPVAEHDVVNNVRLSRCFFFVSDILRQVIEKDNVESVRVKKKPFSITQEQIDSFPSSEYALSLSEITKAINSLIDTTKVKALSYKAIAEFLLDAGILEERINEFGSSRKFPTEQGRAIGIFTEERTGRNGSYTVMLYNMKAQEFILDHMEEIVAMKKWL